MKLSKKFQQFLRLRLGGLEGHCIHVYNFVVIFISFVSIDNLGHILVTLVNKQKNNKKIYNDVTSHLMIKGQKSHKQMSKHF